MADTSIEWTDVTWNPVSGCTRASAGCDHCYAVTMTRRLEAMGQEKYSGLTSVNQRGDRHFNGVVRVHEDALTIPLGWKKPRKVFVNSMSDLFHKDVPFEFIDRVFAVMALCPQHTFQILTKRPERMAEYFSRSDVRAEVGTIALVNALRMGRKDADDFRQIRWPLPNVWLGTSVENQQTADERIPHLLKVPASVRFLSCEPLLDRVDLRYYLDLIYIGKWEKQARWQGTGIHWVIVGGESGHHARPMHMKWVRSLRDQCQSAGVSFFMKQWGEWVPTVQAMEVCNQGGWKFYSPPGDCVMMKVGKKAAGRLLDGRTWDEMPEVNG